MGESWTNEEVDELFKSLDIQKDKFDYHGLLFINFSFFIFL